MSSVTKGTIGSLTTQSAYNVNFDSLYNAVLKPQILAELIQRYGLGIGVHDILYFANRTAPVKGSSETVFEEGSPYKLVTVGAGTIPIANAGAAVAFSLAAADFDTNDKTFLAVGDAVIIPPKYLTVGGAATYEPKHYQITAVDTGVGAAKKFTASPLDKGVAIAVAVPAATKLMVTPGNYAPGSDGAKPKSTGWYSKTYYTAIKKAAWQIEGSSQSNERYIENLKGGGAGIMTRATIDADMRLTKAINDELLIGEVPNNLTMANRDSDDNTVRGTMGLWPTLNAYGMKQFYTAPYAITDFDALKELFLSQGVISGNAVFGVGSKLNEYIENSGLEFLKDYSGGTDLMRSFNDLGIEFKYIKKNTIRYMIQEIASFSDPTSFGADAYYFKEAGFIVPDADVTVRKSMDDVAQIKLKNLRLGYKAYNGEDRTRVAKVLPGMASINGMGGNVAVDAYDDIRGQMLSEFMLLVLKPNQMIRVMPDDVLS
ncbi:MAG: hypothetical protein WC961_07470 [Anaerovoracaceae bacterium]